MRMTTYRHISCLALITLLLMHFLSGAADAAIACYQCHGSGAPVDYRPLDAAYRNPSSGGFQGNHRSHMGATATAAACETCHPGSATYTSAHRDGRIKISSRANGSPSTTSYSNSTSAFPQTAAPALASCTNVNCHFESATPNWGSAVYSDIASCNQCHEGVVPLTATHATHKRYSTGLMGKFSSYAACASCHVNYASPPSFRHATSAGRRPVNVTVGGYNSGSTTYFPSQAHGAFGSCANLYCHSPGNKGDAPFNAPIQTATWGATLPADCTGCHKGSAASFKWMSTGSHNRHVSPNLLGAHRIDCVKCHAVTVNQGLALKDLSKHTNGTVEIAFNSTSSAVNGKYNGAFSPVTKSPGTPYGNCENVYCHSNGQNNGGVGITYKQPVWGNSATGICGKCHDVMAAHTFSGSEISSGSHTKHLASISLATSDLRKCILCHNVGNLPWSGDSCTNTCHTGIAKHADHQINVVMPTELGTTPAYNGSPNPGSGYGACSNVYCHSNGISVSTGTVPANTSPAWGSGVMACNGCHGNMTYSDSRKALPLYTSNRPGAKANSHKAHSSISCNKCHVNTTSDGVTITNTANHINRVYNVNAGGGASFTYTFNVSGGTCSSIGNAGLQCHFNNSAQWGATIACGGCHGVTAATLAGRGHFTHLSSAIGPNSNCDACHGSGASTGGHAGHGDGSINFADGNTLPATTSCNTCHSPGGAYDGVGNATYGAKANWTLGVYSSGLLKGGKEKWCASCHDDSPSAISGVTAPNVAGNETGAYDYGSGWGYYKTGHGLTASATYAASGGRTYGAGKECGSCHDFSTGHIDGNARTYSAAASNYQAGYRLKNIGGKKPMSIPRQNAIPLVADDFRLCFSCHDANKYLSQSPSLVITSFRDDRGDAPSSGDTPPINAHNHHLDNMGLRFDSDWDGSYDSQISCVNCHNVHGSTRIIMINDGKLVNREPGMQIYYAKDGVTAVNPPVLPNAPNNPVTLDQSDGTVWGGATAANICSTCHGGNYSKYYRTPPAAPQAPVLSWTGEAGYTADGVEPNSAQGGNYYSFHVNYTDVNYQMPRSIQVWVDENGNGVYEASEKHDMLGADASDVNCADGKRYRKTIPVAFAGDGTLDYRFYASNGAFEATGAPAGNSTLTVANNAPQLSWTGESGYEADGVNPNGGSGGTSFSFRVKYTDVDNNAPSSIQVWIDENDDGSYDAGEKFDMTAVDPGDTTYNNGKLYTFTRAIPFAGDGVIKYRFYASDGLLAATGTPTTDRTLTVTASNNVPALSWTGETNYVRDGVNPDTDTNGSSFTFRVRYTDTDNNPPSAMQVWVDENNNGVYEAGEKYDMTAVDAGDTDYSDGKLYTKTLPLAASGNGLLNYRFYASDGSANATGTPTDDSIVTLLTGAITVSCSGGKDHTTIQAAINAASSGNTILVSDCTYNEKIIIDGKSITIKSVSGSGTAIIDGGGSGGAVVKFQNGADSTLNGFTVRNGAGGLYGGGIYINNASPAITNSIITANDADNGAGVYLTTTGSSTVTITNSTISNNITSALEGGGLYLGSGGSAVISGSTFSNNQGRYSGGIYMTTSANASLTISGSVFSGNRGTLDGGAIYVTASGGTVPVSITNTIFTNNDANNNGGAIFMTTGSAPATLTITNTLFTGNNTTAQGSALDGGAIYLASVSSTDISNSTFTNNTARNGGALYVSNSGANSLSITYSEISGNSASSLNGGGLYISGGAAGTYTATIDRNTIAGNQADDNGGGMFLTGSVAATITNCMVTGNKAVTLDGGGLYLTGATIAPVIINSTIAGNNANDQGGGIYNLGGSAFELKNSILWNNTDHVNYPDIAGPANVSYSDIWQPGFSGSGNISADPLFVNPLDSSLAPSTGGDHHLLIDSPAMDTGTTTGAPAYDIDGNIRPIGFGIDMGGDEIVSVIYNAPLLTWTGEPDYYSDGVNPNSGASGASFEFRVNYSDSDNNAPNSIQVWVDTNNNDIYEAGEMYDMTAVDAGDTTYTDGKLYTKTLNLNYAGNGSLKYRFYATDSFSQATGQPTADNTVVVNNAPTLSWIGSGNYVNTGVYPETGPAGSNFEFRILYTDQDNTPPTSIQVWVDRNDDGDYLDTGEKITMAPLAQGDTNYADGKEYTATVALSKAGDNTLKYRFYASDGALATGDPVTTEKSVTVTNNAPTLAWTGETNFVGNGVHPDAAMLGNNFTFRVTYADPDNEAPSVYQVWIDENNNGIYEAEEQFDMALAGDAAPANDGNQVNGEIYTKTRILNTAGAIKYKFVFNDASAAATGAPASDSTVTVAASANTAPVLSWATASCLTEGVRPRTGAKDADFEFRVTYSDADNQCPPTPVQVTINGTPYDLTSNDGASCLTGRAYYRTIPVATAGDLSYSFAASDGIDAATGAPATNHTVSVINTTYKVRPEGGSGWYTDLPTAYNATPASGTLLVYPNADFTAATYTGALSNINKTNRTLQSVCGADVTIINGNAATNAIYLQGNDGMVIDGFSVTGGAYNGIYSNTDSMTVKNSKIYSNPTGIGLTGACNPVSVQNSKIYGSTYNGINVNSTSLISIADSEIYNNGVSTAGSGITINGGAGTHSIVRTSFTGNTTTGNGGAIYMNNGAISIDDSSFRNNSAASGGGIFLLNAATATITDTFFQGNTVSGSGGGLQVATGTGTANLTNVMLTGNKATGSGGAIYTTGTANLLFCTISGNYAGNVAGAMYHNSATSYVTTIKNSIIYNNDALNQPNYKQIYAVSGRWQYVDVYNTLINQAIGSGSNTFSYEDQGGNLTASNPNFVSPLNPAAAPTTGGDYHLQSGSPSVNAGNASYTSDHDIFDGTAGSRPKGGAYDMGAHEKE